ncbi:MAG: hypothetical protein ASARMPRED_007219 [Alectoria sarmentosa]|nr:MAG: hypothetical protein ASARMPRED_007219 [Alectoria sarmentosa]
MFAATQSLAAAAFLLRIPPACALFALPAIVGAGLYPYAKRVTYYPQVVLGLILAWGIVMGEVAMGLDPFQSPKITASIGCLFLASTMWTIIYDMIYAHQDLDDDIKAGIKSMAVLYQQSAKNLLWIVLAAISCLLTAGGVLSGLSPVYFVSSVAGTVVSLGLMIQKVELKQPESCMWWFGNGFWSAGGAMAIGLLGQFSGAIVVTILPCPPNRQFFFRAAMRPHLGIYKQLTESGQKPPTHFHPTQWESFRVLQGSLTIDFDGVPRHCGPGDGEVWIRPGTHHVMYGTPGREGEEVEFEIAGGDVGDGGAGMDLGFFENWYGYQEDVFERGQRMDVVQVLSMFDASSTYLSLPGWVPFRSFWGYWLGVIVGRWIGGFLGYAPFYPEWTTDWDAACDKMDRWSQRKFISRDAQERARRKFN